MWNWLRRLIKRLSRGPSQRNQRRPRRALQLELLETRLAPAFDLTIGAGPTVGVLHDKAGDFTAIAHGATIAVSDILKDLQAGKSVTISDGSTGKETGNVTWLAGNNLDFKGIGSGGLQLTIATDPSATAGNVAINAMIFDSLGVSADTLAISISGRGNVQIDGSLLSGAAPISLAADVNANGGGNDGVGTLSIGAGVHVSGSAVTLRGASVVIATGSNPATVSATTQVNTFATGFSGPLALAFDAQGNLYVANDDNGTITKVTPQGQSSVFASGISDPDSLAFDAQGNLYVADYTAGTITKVTPQGQSSLFASGLDTPWGLAFDSQGNLYVANAGNGTITKVTPQGQSSTYASGFDFPNGLAFDSQGNLYVLNNAAASITKVTPQGVKTTIASGFSDLYGLVTDSQGNLDVDDANGTISKVTPQGAVVPIATGLDNPLAVALDSQGNLYVAIDNNGTVSRIAAGSGTVTIRSSLSSRTINVGVATAVTGINLSNAELARLSAPNGLTLGDTSQTGAITVAGASLAGSLLTLQQDPAGPGHIVLNDLNGALPPSAPAVPTSPWRRAPAASSTPGPATIRRRLLPPGRSAWTRPAPSARSPTASSLPRPTTPRSLSAAASSPPVSIWMVWAT